TCVKSSSVDMPSSPTNTTSPPRPPSPPAGPPNGMYFSRRNATAPLPPSPAMTLTRHWSTKRIARASYHEEDCACGADDRGPGRARLVRAEPRRETKPSEDGEHVAARILIIDDNTSLSANLRDVLEGARELDVDVRLAPDGKSGVAAAERDGFDVAVVDVKLPDASGVELMRPLRAAAAEGEIILVTGFATVDTAIAALRAGAFAFILKSFRPEELISTVAQAIEKIALKREREEYERRYRALVDAADVLIVGLDAEGRVTLFNARLSTLTGLAPEAALGLSFAETFVDEADQKRFQHALSAALGHHEGGA